jgi:ABC transport system ATP-binding/permease protein
MAYHNESIGDMAMKVFEKNKILSFRDELVQQYDPVYRDPIPNHRFDFRSHFLPLKNISWVDITTHFGSMFCLYGLCPVLYITLYFESLKKLLDIFSKIKLPILTK